MFCNGRGKRGSLVADVKGPRQRNVSLILFLFILLYLFGDKRVHNYEEREEEET